MKLALALLLVSSSCARASELRLTVSSLSWHFDDRGSSRVVRPADGSRPYRVEREWNHLTFGAGVGYQVNDRARLYAGAFRNSYSHSSRYLVGAWRVTRRLSVAAGYLDGYDRPPFGAALVGELGPVRLVVMPPALSLWFEFGG